MRKVRLTRRDLDRLRRAARAEQTTEREIIRRGIALVDRRIRRKKGIAKLIAMIDGPEPPPIKFRLK